MLVIALQFYRGDWYKAMKLARLLADVEQSRRDDVALMLVRTSECPGGSFVDEAARRCSEVFRVENVVLRPDTPERKARWGSLNRWPIGCNVLWSGAISHFLESMEPCWTSIFTADGGDGVPLHPNWADLLIEDHRRTLHSDLSVTGRVLKDGMGRWHVNGNMVIERSFLQQHPEILIMPDDPISWDVHHAAKILPGCRASSVVHCNWKVVGLRPELFPIIARKAAWWHGYKDGHFVDLARNFILSHTSRADSIDSPRMLDFGKATELAKGNPQPDLEAPPA